MNAQDMDVELKLGAGTILGPSSQGGNLQPETQYESRHQATTISAYGLGSTGQVVQLSQKAAFKSISSTNAYIAGEPRFNMLLEYLTKSLGNWVETRLSYG